MRQVEDALARQTLYGGDVVTNLLEVAPPPATDEAALTAALAEALELPAASVDALRSPEPAAIERVPRQVAEEHAFVPIAIRDGAIVIALAEPLSVNAITAVESALEAKVVQEVAPIVRLRQALERAYGVQMDRRTRRLAAILDGESPDERPQARSLIPDVSDDPQLTPTPTPAVMESSRPPPATTIRTPTAGADALKWFVRGARSDAPKEQRDAPRVSSPGRRRRGPFTREDAEKAFADPQSTDAVLGAVLEFAQQFFAYVALFLVHEDLAEGWDGSGPGAAGDRVRKMGVPLDLPSAFASARDSRAPVIGPRAADGLDTVVATDLERPLEGDVFVAPVVVGKRVVALLYCDDAGDSIDSREVSDVIAVIANAGAALARMILKKKGRAPVAPKQPFTPPPVPVRRSDPSELSGRAEALAKAVVKSPSRPAPKLTPATGAPALKPQSIKPASLEPIVAPVEKTIEKPFSTPPVHKPTLGGIPAVDADIKSVPPPSAPDAPTGLAIGEEHPEDAAALRELEGETPALELPTRVDDAPDEPRTPILQPRSKPFQPIGAAQPPPPNLTGRRALGPVIPREEPSPYERTSEPELLEASEVTDSELEELLELADRSNVDIYDPGRPSERIEIYEAREPPRPLRRSSEHELPKVIVQIEPELAMLVARAIRGGGVGEQASNEVRKLGVAALPAIMDRFPGPTRVDRTAPIDSIPAPSDAGPLLSLLVALGRLAVRDILARTGDPLPETRFWATWLLTEIVESEAAPPLVPRLVDDDLAVRRAAWAAARILMRTHYRSGDTFIEPLTSVILDPGGGLSLRMRSAQALGELRDRRAVDGLIFGLDAREPEIVAQCHESLILITRHDPPRRGGTWPSWYAEHGSQSRVEWLIDALLDEDIGMREAAAAELKDLTKVFFGYYANLPRAEREEAHRRYVAWWNDEGRKKFAGRI
jgi:HEAT repeat protein